ncbi:MAG: glycogen synthase GlgA [Nitrospirota bacterium]|nr:glycogen synthase GlgA [Nitrospirota bacterium]
MHVLIATSEMVPFIKTGGLADVTGALPQALSALGLRVTAVLPLYNLIDREAAGALPHGQPFKVELGHRVVKAQAWRSERPWGDVFFIEQAEYFDRGHLYGPPGGEDPDNAERFAFFSRAIPALCRAHHLIPDVIHVHDWQAALVPVYLKETADGAAPLEHTRTVLTIHNMAYQGNFDITAVNVLGLPPRVLGIEGLEFHGGVNFLKGGILFADSVTTVSPTYAREIREPENGWGLDGVLRVRDEHLTGIVNGIDTCEWDPHTDPHLAAPFSADNTSGRVANREAVQKALGLDTGDDPLIGFVGRVTEQKGLDLLLGILPDLMARGVQLALLGSGDPHMVDRLRQAAHDHPGRVGLATGFDEPLARRIYGGSDLFVMPSRFEPCGLAQLIAMRYGAPPVVHRVGGLADTVTAWESDPDTATGFVFQEARPEALLSAIDRALSVWKDKKEFRALQQNGMRRDSSWDASAAAYAALYKRLPSLTPLHKRRITG